MLLLDRRGFGLVSATTIANSLVRYDNASTSTTMMGQSMTVSHLMSPDSRTILSLPSIPDIVDCIRYFTPSSFRKGVQKSGGRFLYRGEGISTTSSNYYKISKLKRGLTKTGNTAWLERTCPWILNPEPDLLHPDTYGDPEALAYFECLESRLTSQPARAVDAAPTSLMAKPSTGHIATTNANFAGQWGNVVSVWPLGDYLSYVWPQDRIEFFPPDKGTTTCQNDKLVVDRNLVEALRLEREVLFSNWFQHPKSATGGVSSSPGLPILLSAFLTVPLECDAELRKALDIANYGL